MRKTGLSSRLLVTLPSEFLFRKKYMLGERMMLTGEGGKQHRDDNGANMGAWAWATGNGRGQA